jgi:hypothetical protein
VQLQHGQGLPDGIFSNQKSQFGWILECQSMNDVGKLYGHLVYVFNWHFVYFMAICYILWSELYIFPFWYVITKNLALLVGHAMSPEALLKHLYVCTYAHAFFQQIIQGQLLSFLDSGIGLFHKCMNLRCYVFFRNPSCRMPKFRPSLYRKWTKYQNFETSNVRQTKSSTSHFTEPSIVRITNFRMYNIFEKNLQWFPTGVILSSLDLTNLT